MKKRKDVEMQVVIKKKVRKDEKKAQVQSRRREGGGVSERGGGVDGGAWEWTWWVVNSVRAAGVGRVGKGWKTASGKQEGRRRVWVCRGGRVRSG